MSIVKSERKWRHCANTKGGVSVGRIANIHQLISFPAASFWPRNSKLAMRKMRVGKIDIYFSATWEMYFTICCHLLILTFNIPKHWHPYISWRNWVLSNDIFVRCLSEILNIFLCKSQSPGSPIMAVWRGFTVGISLQGKQKEVRSLEEIYICRSGSNLGFGLQRDKKNCFILDSFLEKWKLVLIHNLFIQRSELP